MAYYFAPDTPFYEEKGELPPIKNKKVDFQYTSYIFNPLTKLTLTAIHDNPNRSANFVKLGYNGLEVLTLVEPSKVSDKLEHNSLGSSKPVNTSGSSVLLRFSVNDISQIPTKGLVYLGSLGTDSFDYVFKSDFNFLKRNKSHFFELENTLDFTDTARSWLFSEKITSISLFRTANTIVNGINIFRSVKALGIVGNSTEPGVYYISKEIYDNLGYSYSHPDHTTLKNAKTFFIYNGQNDDYVLVSTISVTKTENHPSDDTLYKIDRHTSDSYVQKHTGGTRSLINNTSYNRDSFFTSQVGGFFLIPKRNTWKRNNNPTTGWDVNGAEYLPDLPINTVINKIPSRYLDFLTAKKSRAGDLWIGNDVSIEQLERMINLAFYFLYNPRTNRNLGYKGHEEVDKKTRRKNTSYYYSDYELEVLENSIIPVNVWDRDDITNFDFKVYSDGYNLFKYSNLFSIPDNNLIREYIRYNILAKRPKPVMIQGSSQDTDRFNFQLLNFKYSRDHKKLNLDEIIDTVKEIAKQYANISRAVWGMKKDHTSYVSYNNSTYTTFNNDTLVDYFFFKDNVGSIEQQKSTILSEINSFSFRQVPELEKSIRTGGEITPYMLYYLIISISNIIYKRITRHNNYYEPGSVNTSSYELEGCHASSSCHSSCHGSAPRSCHTVYAGSTYNPHGGGTLHTMNSPNNRLYNSGKAGYYWDTSVGGKPPPGWTGQVV